MDNILIPVSPDIDGFKCDIIKDTKSIIEKYADSLVDESRMEPGLPDRIYFPKTTLEVVSAIREIQKRERRVTIGGARTGIVGGAVATESNSLLSLENITFKPRLNYNKSTNRWTIRVGAGTRLKELHNYLKKKNYISSIEPPSNLFYPVDPTELSASIGGNVSTNASGARTLHYGPTRNWVEALTIVLADSRVLNIRRGEKYVKEKHFFLQMPDMSLTEILIPNITIPSTKHVAGYYLNENMDIIDLFIGSEGTLGIITEVELRTCFPYKNNLYILVFLPQCNYLSLVQDIKKSNLVNLLALEYMDKRSVKLLSEYREKQGKSDIPFIPDKTEGILYIELGFDKENKNILLDELSKLLVDNNISIDSTWVASTQAEFNKMKKLRHALPERINSIIAERKARLPNITKVATDMAVPNNALEKIIKLYESTLNLKNIEYYMFGHIGNNHLHVNIIPDSIQEIEKARELYKMFAQKVVELKGSVAAEHGIGKLKKDFLKIQFPKISLEKMKLLKHQFDPNNILNPGVLF
jgi:D-lactate dehydrogenase (cytochrome)